MIEEAQIVLHKAHQPPDRNRAKGARSPFAIAEVRAGP
jgi:hypothetical protein